MSDESEVLRLRALSDLAGEAARLAGSRDAAPLAGDAVAEVRRALRALAAQRDGALRKADRRFEDLAEAVAAGVGRTDATGGSLFFANPALCSMLRAAPSALARAPVASLFRRPEDGAALLNLTFEAGRVRGFEAELLRGDGSVFPASVSAWLSEQEGATAIDLVVRDLADHRDSQQRERDRTQALFGLYGELGRTHEALQAAHGEMAERVRSQTEELRTAYEALKSADSAKTEFLMSLSHELRTPLHCIIGYSEAMIDGLDGPLTGEQTSSLRRIVESGRRLLRLIEDLLDLSRLETGTVEFRPVAMNIAEALDDVVQQSRPLAARRPVSLELTLDGSLPAVWADPDRVRQVLFNLVGNALRFTDRGSVRLAARRSEPAAVEVRVCDTGPGIPVDQRERVFERFAQVSGRDRSGAGLGLSICRELLERMGGRIWIEGDPGEGSVFAFTLPAPAPRSQLSLPFGAREATKGAPMPDPADDALRGA